MIIRPATEADIAPAAAIVAGAYRTSFRPILGEAALAYDGAHFQERFEKDLERLTVLDDGGVKGVLLVTEGHIAMLFIDEGGRGKGHGAALLAHAEAQGTHSLEVFAANAGARRFYERAGWTQTGEYARDFAGAARDFVRYEKHDRGRHESPSPHPEEPRSGVSKDGSERAGASFETRAAPAPQDEGSRGTPEDD